MFFFLQAEMKKSVVLFAVSIENLKTLKFTYIFETVLVFPILCG